MKLKDKRIKSLLILFLIYFIILIAATIGYNEFPIYIKYSVLGEDSFYLGFITNMYNSVLDFAMFSIVLFILLRRHDEDDKIQKYKDNIEDCRYWYAEEAAFRNVGNIRRLQELGIQELNLSKTTLLNTKLKNITFVNTLLMGSCLDGTNFEKSIFKKCNFQGASAKKSSFNNAQFQDCNFRYIDFSESQLKSCKFVNCDFTKTKLSKVVFSASSFKNCQFSAAALENSVFDRADLRGAKELTLNQLLSCNSIEYALLDTLLAEELSKTHPLLLKRKTIPPDKIH